MLRNRLPSLDLAGFNGRLLRLLTGGFGLLLLLACSRPEYVVDESFASAAQDSRVRFIVLHYPSENNADSLRLLTQDKVSAHYLLTAGKTPVLYRLVDENRRAWHAGVSQWYGYKSLNAMSIGIEVVNLGPLDERQTQWDAYSPGQISLLATLLRDLARRHGIKAKHIVGHSDIAPQRKIDPGPLFPWEALAKQGIGRWYDENRVRQYEARFAAEGLPNLLWFQEKLRHIGYEVEFGPDAQASTGRVLRAFQMHYRPQRYDGLPDIQTAAILMDLSMQEDD